MHAIKIALVALAVHCFAATCEKNDIIAEWMKAAVNEDTEVVQNALEAYRLALAYNFEEDDAEVKAANTTSICQTCQQLLPKLADIVSKDPAFYDKVVEFAKWVCIAKQLQPTQRACIGTVETLKDVYYQVVIPTSRTAPKTMCSILTGLSCGKTDDPTNAWWSVQIPSKTSSSFKYSQKRRSTGRNMTILHISDPHMDLQYAIDSPADCIEWMCCRYDSPASSANYQRAGPFGEYKCDLPASTLELLLKHIKNTNTQIDAVYLTGDYTPHDDWYQTKPSYLATIGAVNRIVKTTFQSIPVYMVIGNHDTVPPNKFPNPTQSKNGETNMTWLYNYLADEWIDSYGWLPKDTEADVRQAGIYTTLVRPGLRIIGINDMGCEPRNWWLFINSTDPEGVLNQLVTWLLTAEQSSEKVHLIMHIEPGATGRCLKVWSWNYYSIVSRFRDTIVGQFSGHSHETYFMIYYDDVTFTTPISTLYVGPSLVPFIDDNPGYRVVTVDADTFRPLDYSIFYVDLPESNRQGSLIVNKLYSAKATFSLPDLSAQSWHDLAIRFQTDDQLFQLYYSFTRRLAKTESCTGDCKRKALCKIHTSRADDPAMCDRFVPKQLPNNGPFAIEGSVLLLLSALLANMFL